MAIQTGNATSNGSFSNVSIRGTTSKTGYIELDIPSLPNNATIISTTLTAKLTIRMFRGTTTVTINGKSYSSSSNISVDLGNFIQTTLSVTCKGNNSNAIGIVSMSNIIYAVTYQYDDGVVETIKQIYIGDINISNIKMGNSSITKVYIGDTLIWEA